jgi:dihydroorotate dehydrogenase (NAD+) catalytic subunit
VEVVLGVRQKGEGTGHQALGTSTQDSALRTQNPEQDSGRRTQDKKMTIDLSVELAPNHKQGLRLANPVMVASGCFGWGTEYAKLIDIQRLGAIISKGTTLRPRKGNPMPRVAETPAGMLNAIGLQNPGIHRVIAEKAPIWSTWRVPVLVNVAGEDIDEFCECARLLEGVPGVAGIELNVSCPNVKAGGAVFACDPTSAGDVTSAVRSATTLPLIVKLSPNVGDIVSIALAVEKAGADCISLINTLLGMKIDIKRRRPLLGNVTGGLSGPAIRPVAVRMVYQIAQVVSIPIVGLGGITSAEDALEFILAGASAIQIGTGIFVDPTAPLRIIDELAQFIESEGVGCLSELVGAANPHFAGHRQQQSAFSDRQLPEELIAGS